MSVVARHRSLAPRGALLAALACLLGLIATAIVALLVPQARARDLDTLQGFVALDRGPVARAAGHVVHLCDPATYALIGAALVAVALARRRWRVAGTFAIVLVAAPLTTELLKPLLATPRGEEWWGAANISAGSWPSGHSTAAMTLALGLVLVSPNRLRPLAAAVAALWSAAIAFGILVLAWHFPSDVLGGFLVAGLWTALAAGVLLRGQEPHPLAVADLRAQWRSAAALVVGVGLVAALAAALAVGPRAVGSFAHHHTTAVAGGAVIAALGMALAAGLARALSRA